MHNIYVIDRLDCLEQEQSILAVRMEHVSPEHRQWLSQTVSSLQGNGGNLSETADGALILTASRQAILAVISEMRLRNLFPALADGLQQALDGEARSREMRRTLKCRNLTLEIGQRTLIMGILNVTPDSFSDGGKYFSVDAAVRRALQMVEEGADLIDLGGVSTRPGFQPVSLEEELKRVIPVLRELVRAVDVPISIDTYKSEVARQALEIGAHIINDQWRLTADPNMASVAAEYQCPVILMHNRHNKDYANLLSGIVGDLRESIEIARRAGVRDEQIILDPGIGFAKTYEDNLAAMRQLKAISMLGYPVLLATSRKSVIQRTLGLPPGEVVEGTAATVAYGIAQGCHMVRVHDVKEMKKVAAMADAIVQAGN